MPQVPNSSPFPSDNCQLTTDSPATHQSILSRYGCIRYESKQQFDTLVREVQHSYQPRTPAEELAAFRVTQSLWRIRRMDHLEAAFFESAIQQARQQHPQAAAAAGIATLFMDPKQSQAARFLDTTQKQRREDELTLERQLHYLFRLQAKREAQELRQANALRQAHEFQQTLALREALLQHPGYLPQLAADSRAQGRFHMAPAVAPATGVASWPILRDPFRFSGRLFGLPVVGWFTILCLFGCSITIIASMALHRLPITAAS